MSNVIKIMLVSLITNIFLSLAKIIVGVIGTSQALISDGVHSFSDLITDIVAMFGDKLSRLPADHEHPYGHGRLEYVASIIIGLIILILGLSLFGNAFSTDISHPTNLVFYICIVTIFVKWCLAKFIINNGLKLKNNILISSGKESKTDVLSSTVVLISFLFSKLSKYHNIFTYADKVGSIIVSLLIIKIGFDILKENTLTVLGESETSEYHDKIRNLIMEEEMVDKIDRLYILKYGSYNKVTCEISMDGNMSLQKSHEIAHQIEKRLKQNEKIRYVTIHINPSKESSD